MQHKVPQFIDIEDKIFGPFTLRQFAYLAGGLGLSIIVWRSVPMTYGIFLIAPTIALTIALMFVKPNGKPFVFMVQSFFQYIFGTRMYKWQSPTQAQTRAQNKVLSDLRNASNANTGVKVKSVSREQIENLANKLNNKF